MFSNLLESKPKKQRTLGGAVISTVLHAVLITAAVFGTMQAREQLEKPKEEKVEFVEMKKDEPPPPEPEKAPPPPDVVAAPPPPKGFQVLTAPVEIPDVIPDVDLTKAVTNEEDFSGKGVAGGIAKGVAGGTGPVTDQPYFEFQVEKPAIPAPGNSPPRYPETLQKASISGEVLAQFVVDTLGRADMSTFKVLKSDNKLFEIAVRNVLPSHRFLPAETGGRKVRMWVQQPFVFAIQ
jgi:protein TonB